MIIYKYILHITKLFVPLKDQNEIFKKVGPGKYDIYYGYRVNDNEKEVELGKNTAEIYLEP